MLDVGSQKVEIAEGRNSRRIFAGSRKQEDGTRGYRIVQPGFVSPFSISPLHFFASSTRQLVNSSANDLN
jgi:hypothetical protein